MSSSDATVVRKRCDTCGREVQVFRRRRTCMQAERNSKGFKTGWRCPGKLVTAKARRKRAPLPPVPKGLGIGHVLTPEYQAQAQALRMAAVRARDAKRLKKARVMLKAKLQQAARAERLCRKWTAQVRHYERRVKMTDAELQDGSARAAHASRIGRVKRRLLGAAKEPA